MSSSSNRVQFDNIELAIFSGRLNAICEEMGYVLKRTALSPNIKDRLDFSCAFFNMDGHICAQAAHIPVHLGSMAYAMTNLVRMFEWFEGDVVILNDPFLGGTHLPDVTVISPFYYQGELQGFFANRAHHANIGSSSPGSMPISSDIREEGVLISPCKLYEKGIMVAEVAGKLSKIENDVPGRVPGDFLAQISANKVGMNRISDWLDSTENGSQYLDSGLKAVNNYGRQLAEKALSELPVGSAACTEYLDGDGFGAEKIPINVTITISINKIEIDFKGTSGQVKGNLNCPISVSAASVYYVIICLLPPYAPHCHGVFEAIDIYASEGSLLNARSGAAVAAGNVETSMRIVDCVLGGLAKLGVNVPAASQGTMNNIALGGVGKKRWDYYETIGGGMGASNEYKGISGVQCHLTNTLNTPVESLEMHYPLRVKEYSIRYGSGGEGHHSGGDGLIRSYEFIEATSVTLLTERRKISPWGLKGGENGSVGENILNDAILPDKVALKVKADDVLTILSPGGGAWGVC